MSLAVKNLEAIVSQETVPAEPIEEIKIPAIEAEVRVEDIIDKLEVRRPNISYEFVHSAIKKVTPSAPGEIVDWMFDSATANILTMYHAESYRDAGGDIVFKSNDAYIPGVVDVGGYSILSQTGEVIRRQGYYVIVDSEGHRYQGRLHDRTWVPRRDALGIGMWIGYLQWRALLLKFRKYASLPVGDAGFIKTGPGAQIPIVSYKVDSRYLCVPFVAKYTTITPLAVNLRIKLQTYDPVEPYIVFTYQNRKPAGKVKIEKLGGDNQYILLVRAPGMPMQGYVEFYADVARPPTILGMEVMPVWGRGM